MPHSNPFELGWEAAILDVGDLGRGEGHDLVIRVIPIIDIEIVKITSGSTHDDHFDGIFHLFLKCHQAVTQNSQKVANIIS